MRHFEALRGHFRQDLADPAHFVLVRTCKGHIPLDITNFSTSRHLPVTATSPGSRILLTSRRTLRSPGSSDPPTSGPQSARSGNSRIPASRQGNPGFPASAPGAPREAGFPPRRRNSRLGAGIPSCGEGIPPAGREIPDSPPGREIRNFPARDRNSCPGGPPAGTPPQTPVFQF